MKSTSAVVTEPHIPARRWDAYDFEMLDRIQKRVLWLSTYIVHYANFIRSNPDSIKVGGHQASSASVVTLLTALYFHFLRSGDLVSIKPHASPVFHAIQFLRGFLPAEQLRTFRQCGGLQAYPSRTKDIDGVDFSTGSVGLGAVAPIFGALVRDYIVDHFGESDRPGSGWQIALVGDAELDEGNVWEALGEEFTQRLSRVLWIIDLNRQSLDRVIPDGRAQKLREMFQINGWHVIDLKYGEKLQQLFRRPYGLKLRAQIDEMSNEEYQSLLLKDGETIRSRLIARDGVNDEAMADLLSGYHPSELAELLANLGGHDLESVFAAYEKAFSVRGQPVAIFAYTIKGWGLPIAGNPANHSRLLKMAELDSLRDRLGIAPGEEFSTFAEQSEEARYIRRTLEAGNWISPTETRAAPPAIDLPASLGLGYKGAISTQSALGSVLVNLARKPDVAPYLVTVSPDVAMSTNLGGWIHKAGIYSRRHTKNYFKEQGISLLIDWQESAAGRHIELGISETNLFLQLGLLGLSDQLYGQRLLPIGTVYDPFVSRALDAFTYGVYSKSRFIVVGTPSGISLSYEGGAHQSVITPGIGVQLPDLDYYEPAFGQELEWILLASLNNLQDTQRGRSAYLRLSTKPIEQGPFNELLAGTSEEELHRQVLRGGYRLVDCSGEKDYRPGENAVHLFVVGAMVTEAMAAAHALQGQRILANVFVITSPDLLFQDHMAAEREKMAGGERQSWLEKMIAGDERSAPVVTVQDGHPHTLSFVGGVLRSRMINLGVTAFGQSGSQADLYRIHGISADDVAAAARWLVRERGYRKGVEVR